MQKNKKTKTLIDRDSSLLIVKEPRFPWLWLIAGLSCICIFIIGLLATTIPLYRNPIYFLSSQSGISREIVKLAGIMPLPENLGFDQNTLNSAHITNFWEFTLLIAGLFIVYGLCALLLYKKRGKDYTLQICLFIFCIAALAGYIYVYTPGTLSEDVYLYANYGRVLAIHGANPYFVPPAAFPQDPSYQFVYWKHIVSIYGPVWILISAALAKVAGTSQFGYFLTFRLFAYILHLLNIILVSTILWLSGRSARTITVGTLLYAWNPLVLFEGCIGGHNDICIATCLLLGILWGTLVEKRGKISYLTSIPLLVTFMLAVLIKLTMLPIVLLLIVMLVCQKYRLGMTTKVLAGEGRQHNSQAALGMLCYASALCLIVAGVFYGPFWVGHPLRDIVYSFTSQPPNGNAFNSLLSALQIWDKVQPLPHKLTLLLNNRLWNATTIILMVATLIIGGLHLWRRPGIRTVALEALAPLGAFLLTTNWFLPWYLIVPVCLLAITLPRADEKWGYVLIAFTLLLSATAFLSYYYNFIGTYYIHFQPDQGWKLALAYTVQFALPLLAFLVLLIFRIWQSPRSQPYVVK